MPVTITGFQPNGFQNTGFQIAGVVPIVLASYRLLSPHVIQGVYLDANAIVTEGGAIPFGWVPTLAVDPLSSTAVSAFYMAGPRYPGEYEDLNNWSYFRSSFNQPQPSVTHWHKSGVFWSLTGLGTGFPPVGAV